MNDLILAYVRVACFAAVCCANIVARTNCYGESRKRAIEYVDSLEKREKKKLTKFKPSKNKSLWS